MEKVLFKCKISDGAVFKAFAAVLSYDSVVYVMTILKDKLVFSQCSTPDSSITGAEFYRNELNDWENNFENDVSFTFQSRDLSNGTNIIKRAENMTIYMESTDIIALSISHKAVSSENVTFIRCEQLPSAVTISENSMYGSEDFPNIVEQCNAVTTSCSTLIKQKCNMIKVIGKKTMLILAGISGDQVYSIQKFGSDSQKSEDSKQKLFFGTALDKRLVVADPDEYVTFNVNHNLLTLLSKACKITPNANVKIYIIPNGPIKIVTPIFTYGKLRIYIINPLTAEKQLVSS